MLIRQLDPQQFPKPIKHEPGNIIISEVPLAHLPLAANRIPWKPRSLSHNPTSHVDLPVGRKRERVPSMGTSQGNLRHRPRPWTPRIRPAWGTWRPLRRISTSTCSDRRPIGVRNRVPCNFISLSVFLALELVPCSVICSVGEDPKASYSVF
jgi:hypothetical protein